MRAKAGMDTSEMPMTTFFRSAPRKATMAIRRMRAGKARKMSTAAMRIVSVRPRRKPASSPMVPPTTMPMASTPKATTSDTRPP